MVFGLWEVTNKTSYNLEEVTAGFLANDNLLIRTQYLDENGHPTVLSREASIAKIKKDGS